MIILLILGFLVIVFFEIPDLIRKKYWRELAVFSVLLVAAFILALLQTAGVDIPSPFTVIIYLIRDILHLNYE